MALWSHVRGSLTNALFIAQFLVISKYCHNYVYRQDSHPTTLQHPPGKYVVTSASRCGLLAYHGGVLSPVAQPATPAQPTGHDLPGRQEEDGVEFAQDHLSQTAGGGGWVEVKAVLGAFNSRHKHYIPTREPHQLHTGPLCNHRYTQHKLTCSEYTTGQTHAHDTHEAQPASRSAAG